MPWHLSKSDLRKVYDDRHGDVAVCQTPEQAALIVEAVNLYHTTHHPSIRLREPQPVGLPERTHAHLAEGCCARAISKALLAGGLNSASVFACPKCGTEYRPRQEGPVTHWEARADAMVFSPRR